MRNKIEFVNNAGIAPDPIAKSREASYLDLSFKEEFRKMTCRFRQGITWLRFLPSVKGSAYDWLMPVDAYQDMDGTTLISATTFDRNNINFFDLASSWVRKNRPELMSNKDTNPNGLRLWPKRTGIGWVIEEQAPEGERLRLFKGSLYDGVRGGSTGLAYNIHLEANSRDNEPNSATLGQLVYGDITAPNAGRLVKIEKLPTSQSEFANYKIGIGKNSAPLEALMTLLTDEEHNLICPLEKVIHIPTEAEQKDALRRYIGPALFTEIFGAEKVISTPAPARPREVISSDGPEPDSEPAPAKPAAAPAAAAEPAPVVEKAAEPAPAVAAPAAAAPAAEEIKPYTTREVTTLLGKEVEGVKELIANKNRIPKGLYAVVEENAQELGLSMGD